MSEPFPLDHLERLSTGLGLWQHARHAVPDRRHGLCLDDNARALWLCARLARLAPPDGPLLRLAIAYAAFVDHAWDATSGRFANFMAADGRWIDGPEDEDASARALLALVAAAASPLPEGIAGWARDRAAEVLASGAPLRHRAPRAWCWSLGAARRAPAAGLDMEAEGDALAGRLLGLWRASAGPGWPWFEPALAYDSGRLVEGALDGARWRPALGGAGLEAMRWLSGVVTAPEGHHRPPGSEGYGRPGPPARHAQQPIDAWAHLEAALAARRETGDGAWLAEARRAHAWFGGANDAGRPLAEPDGACRDGIDPQGVSVNRGAESTLARLHADAAMALAG